MTADRRTIGLAALLLAAVALIVAPNALRGRSVSGAADHLPYPAPPAVGACIADAQGADVTTVVPCSDPHVLEITAAWSADDRDRLTPINDPAWCVDTGSRYVGTNGAQPFGDWRLAFPIETAALNAPRRERVGPIGWTACAVAAADRSTLTRSIFGAAHDPLDFPGEHTSCLTAAESGGFRPTTCAIPHVSETLATAIVSARYEHIQVAQDTGYRSVTVSTAAPTCLALAIDIIGTADPTYGGALTIAQEQVLPFTEDDVAAGTATVQCVARVVSGREITGSLIALGNRPLPYSN